MKIPKQVTVGKKKIEVLQYKTVTIGKQACRGSYHTLEKKIRLAKKDLQGNTFTKNERSETFWHELTHAILHDMNHKLTFNEKFVIGFSQRLDQAIRSAKF